MLSYVIYDIIMSSSSFSLAKNIQGNVQNKKHSKIPWLNNGCILQCPLQPVSSDLLRLHWTGILYSNKIMLTEFPVLFVILKSLKITPEFLFCSGYDYNN